MSRTTALRFILRKYKFSISRTFYSIYPYAAAVLSRTSLSTLVSAHRFAHSNSSIGPGSIESKMLVQTLIWLSLLLATTLATQYECLPYPVKSVCMIEHISYHHDGEPITFPTGYEYYRITLSGSLKNATSSVTIFDETLYEAMHRPSSIEMRHTHMKQLTLPPELLLGIFADNSISSVKIEAGRDYRISYLDLNVNSLTGIEFVSSLVNLEVLNLNGNSISNIPGSALTSLTKLKYIYLQHNAFSSIPWSDLPHSLNHLDCQYSNVRSADFTNISLPSLQYLNLQDNYLSTINVTALLRAAPRLKEAHLTNFLIDVDEMENINSALTSSNISFVDSERYNSYCRWDDDYDYVGGRCVLRQRGPVGTGMAILLSGVVIGAAALFVYIVVIVFRHMNR